MKRIAILGSTGSIGCSTLRIVESYPERFQVATLAAGSNSKLAFEQAMQWKPRVVSLANERDADAIRAKLRASGYGPRRHSCRCGFRGERDCWRLGT